MLVWTVDKFIDPGHGANILKGFYSSENRQMRVFVVFAVIAIIISAIGLLGLTAFTAKRKTKEIGIRKVLGARTFDII